MKHKVICLILCLLLLPSLFLSVGARQTEQYIIDNADLLSASEEASLGVKALALRQKYGMDVVVLTVDSLEGAAGLRR